MANTIRLFDDSFDDFKAFLDPFLKRNKGYCPSNLKLWYDTVQKNHSKIRHQIQGSRIQSFLNIESGQESATPEEVKPYFDLITKLYPNFFKDSSRDINFLCSPTVAIKAGKIQKVSKILSNYNHDRNEYTEFGPMLAELGKIWAKHKTNKQELEGTLSTNAKAFVLLGHYGPDKESCFRQCSSSDKDKYCLGQSEESFVITISKKDKDEYTNQSRCFGFLVGNEIHTFNYYFKKTFSQEGDGIATIEKILSNAFGTEYVFNSESNLDRYPDKYLYLNDSCRWAFVKAGHNISGHKSVININGDNIRHVICPSCLKLVQIGTPFVKVDEQMVCQNCATKAKVCYISGYPTLKPTVEVHTNNFEIVVCRLDLAEKHCKKCNDCERFFLSLENKIQDNKLICEDCYSTYDECDECEEIHSEEELLDVFERLICKKCFANKEIQFSDEEIRYLTND